MNRRRSFAVTGGLVISFVLVLVGLFKVGPWTLNNELPPNEPEISTSPETSQQGRFAYIGLTKVNSEPEVYVELTDEEFEMFPALQASLQALEESGKSTIMYKTSEHTAMAPLHYLEKKYQDHGSWNYIFKYGENFYSIAVAVT